MTGRSSRSVSKVYIIGIGFRPLEKKASYVVQKSDKVLVNDRLREVFKNYSEYESVKDRIIVQGSVYETLDYIAANYQRLKLSLLAAGDPMFFGIGRLVVERLGQDAVEVFPDLSSIQVAFSRVKETANNALLISLHGGPDPAKRRKMEYKLSDLPGLIREHAKIAILTDRVNSPETIAGELLKPSAVSSQVSALQMYVCEKLGYPDERVIKGPPEDIAKGSFEHPNVVILKRAEALGAIHELPSPVFGLTESEISHSRGLITKDEVRAITIHKLRLPREGIFWDIGAGSGSISLEAARLCPGLKVIAIEREEERATNIRENSARYGASNIDVMQGEAPVILNGLPAPERVFIGGSGGELDTIVSVISGKMASGIVVINAATIETLNESIRCLDSNGFTVDIVEASVSRSKMVGNKRHMSALNPVFIIKGEK